MSMFKKTLDDSLSKDDLANRLKTEAILMKSQIIAEQPDRLSLFIEQHTKDLKLYEFNCQRYGDFLALFMTRGEKHDRKYYWEKSSNKIISAVSLMLSTEIKLVEGQPPDNLGQANFVKSYNAEKKEYEVLVQYPEVGSSRPMVVTDKMNISQYGYGGHDYIQGVSVDGCAIPAQDDKIQIVGAGVTIHAPCGKGKMVMEKILLAIKEGDGQ